MSTRTIRIITAFIALTSGILAIGDKLTAMPGLPGWVTSSWPLVLAIATIFNHVAHILIDPAVPAPAPAPQQPPVPLSVVAKQEAAK